MIFVTVGTHEQQFDRLIKEVDLLKKNGFIKDEVFIQTGYSTYQPRFCNWSKFLPYKEMLNMVKKSDIVITHGGPSSFIMALQLEKVPIVVPRKKEFDEHINDHQYEFVKTISERSGNIICVYDVKKLKDTIINYQDILENRPKGMKSNNSTFNHELEKLVMKL